MCRIPLRSNAGRAVRRRGSHHDPSRCHYAWRECRPKGLFGPLVVTRWCHWNREGGWDAICNAHKNRPLENGSTTIYNNAEVPQKNPKLHLPYTRNVSSIVKAGELPCNTKQKIPGTRWSSLGHSPRKYRQEGDCQKPNHQDHWSPV